MVVIIVADKTFVLLLRNLESLPHDILHQLWDPSAILRTCLIVVDLVAVCKLLCFLLAYFAIIPATQTRSVTQVQFIAREDHGNITLALVFHFTDPVSHLQERLTIRQVKVQDHAICLLEVAEHEGKVALLPRCIPELNLALVRTWILVDVGYVSDADRELSVLNERIGCVPVQDRGLSSRDVAD